MFVGVTNTRLGGNKDAREKEEYLLLKRKTKKERKKIIVMSPIKFHTGIIFNYKRNSRIESKTALDVLC